MSKLVARAKVAAGRYEQFEKALAYIAGAIIIVMAFAITADVILRYAFRAPLRWAFELNMNLLIYFAFLGGAYTLATGGHVRVDILFSRWSPRKQAIADLFTFMVALTFIVILTWQSIDMSLYSLAHDKRSLQVMMWPVFPTQIIIPIGAVLVGLQIVIKMARDIHLLLSGDSSNPNT